MWLIIRSYIINHSSIFYAIPSVQSSLNRANSCISIAFYASFNLRFASSKFLLASSFCLCNIPVPLIFDLEAASINRFLAIPVFIASRSWVLVLLRHAPPHYTTSRNSTFIIIMSPTFSVSSLMSRFSLIPSFCHIYYILPK